MTRWLCAISVVLLATGVSIAEPTTRPREAVAADGCTRGQCHAERTAYPVVHGPVATSACDACHELTSAAAHTFRLTREKAELCTYCHEFDISMMPVIHKPVAEGECLGCHDPHGGASSTLLRERTVQETCNRCHEDITAGRAVLHTPAKEGACDSCHAPHAARFAGLLDLAGPDLCIACHEHFEATLSQVKFTHKALEKGCRQCHDPHGSAHAMSTTQPVTQQCGGCHPQVLAAAANARVPHTPVTKDRACLTCHTPHGSSLAKLAADLPETICMSCHREPQRTARGEVVPAVAELVKPAHTNHGGIKDGTCSGCHNAHGADRRLLLSKNYSPRIYQRYSHEQYELCFECHDPRIVDASLTLTFTRFRNGERNLHTLHVRDLRQFGESCGVCHNNHAGNNDAIVRDAVAYGAWRMPVRFTKSTSGGACFPGCHPRYGYDRDAPITNRLGLPTTLPMTPARADEKPAVVSIAATDTRGRALTVPARGVTSIIVIARADRERDELFDLMARQPEAQLIAILCGAAPASRSRDRLARDPRWRVLLDPDTSLARRLDVSGLPMVLVIRPDGVEIARIAGSAESLALKLPSYLELAAGRAPPRPTSRPAIITGRHRRGPPAR